jgi:hypothetical protein
MAIPTSVITLSSIQGEFGGENPISLSEYYRSPPPIPNAPSNFVRPEVTSVPLSGTISMGDFAGTSQPIPNSTKIGIVVDGFIFKGGPINKSLQAAVSTTANPNVGGPLRNRYFNVSSSLYNKAIRTYLQESNGNFGFTVSSNVTTTAGVFTSIRVNNQFGTFSINRSSMTQIKFSNQMRYSVTTTNSFLYNVSTGTSVIVCIN